MSRLALLASTIVTVGYAYVVGSTMAADRAATIARVTAAEAKAEAASHTVNTDRLWYGGTLPAITVTAQRGYLLRAAVAPERCPTARVI